jgi:Family of unknown function (DUF6188)
MSKLLESLDPNHLLGRTLEQIGYSINTIHLWFDEMATIVVLGSVDHWASQEAAVNHEELPLRESRLVGLLGQSIVRADKIDEASIEIVFSDGQRLILNPTSEYESYHITLGAQTWIV